MNRDTKAVLKELYPLSQLMEIDEKPYQDTKLRIQRIIDRIDVLDTPDLKRVREELTYARENMGIDTARHRKEAMFLVRRLIVNMEGGALA